MSYQSNRGSRLRAGIAVVVSAFSLLSASVIVGYASDVLWPATRHSAQIAAEGKGLEAARLDAQDTGSHQSGGTDTSGQADDPLINYSDALDLLKSNYYGAPIDAKKSRDLTYEAIRGMLGSLGDMFSTYLDPAEWK